MVCVSPHTLVGVPAVVPLMAAAAVVRSCVLQQVMATLLVCTALLVSGGCLVPRPFPPPVFHRFQYFILEAMKYWWWERPGNEARVEVVCMLLTLIVLLVSRISM